MPDPFAAVAYGRFSERPSPEDSRSLDVQRERCRAYASFYRDSDGQGPLTIVETLEDPETSGRKDYLRKRPAGARLLELVGPRKVRHIVAFKLDRLFRSVEDGLRHIKRWTRQGVTLHLACEGGNCMNTSTSWGWKMVANRLVDAEGEALQIAERTSIAMRQHMANGYAMGGKPPYGYDLGEPIVEIVRGKQRERKTWVESPAEQAVIETVILPLYDAGETCNAIAARLNRDGVPSKFGGLWGHQAVKGIIERARR